MANAVELPVGDRLVRVSSPDKVYFPETGITKLQVVEYFVSVGDGILRAVRDRPTTLQRHPEGVAGEAFYQKRAPQGAPEWIQTARISFPSGRHADELCPTELAAVIWAANLGTLTFHPWPVRCEDVDRPDELRIDLDPQPGTDFRDAVAVAHQLRALLDEMGMRGFPKTSGGRGVHVLVRIEPRWTFTEVRRSAIALARELERRMPDLVTTAWWKEQRGAKVLPDYNQMARDRTVASAYSVRPTPIATVSAPVRWEDLDDVDPLDFTVKTMPSRFAELGDLHAEIDKVAHSIEPLLEMAERDEHDHELGDMPYPPEYPKMPGEPKRVQPSRAKRLTSGNTPE